MIAGEGQTVDVFYWISRGRRTCEPDIINYGMLQRPKGNLTLTVLKESRWVVLFPLKEGGEGTKGFLVDNPPAPHSALARLIPNHVLMILTGS